MMNIYEYFLQRVGFKIRPISEMQHMLRFKNRSEFNFSWAFYEDGDEIGLTYGHVEKWTVCKCAFNELRKGNEFLEQRRTYWSAAAFSDKFIDKCRKIVLVAAELPEALLFDDKDEIDLLVTLNGINKGA